MNIMVHVLIASKNEVRDKQQMVLAFTGTRDLKKVDLNLRNFY